MRLCVAHSSRIDRHGGFLWWRGNADERFLRAVFLLAGEALQMEAEDTAHTRRDMGHVQCAYFALDDSLFTVGFRCRPLSFWSQWLCGGAARTPLGSRALQL